MRALRVVEPDPIIDDLLCLEVVGDFMKVDGLLFQGSPEPVNEDCCLDIGPSHLLPAGDL